MRTRQARSPSASRRNVNADEACRANDWACRSPRGRADTIIAMDHLTGTRIRREATPATVNLRRCKLVIIKGAQRGTEFVIAGDVIRIGKAPENDPCSPTRPRRACTSRSCASAKGYLVRDHKSTNGTFLDSARGQGGVPARGLGRSARARASSSSRRSKSASRSSRPTRSSSARWSGARPRCARSSA